MKNYWLRSRFDRLAHQALDKLPDDILRLLHNIEIDVQAVPGAEAGRLKGSKVLLGLYKGLKREQMMSPLSGSYLPARIILYQKNLEALCRTEVELKRRIELTLRHEIAHHLGFSEEDIRRRWPEGAC